MNNNLTTSVVSGALTRSEFGESDVDNYFENNKGRIHARSVNLRVSTQDVDGSSLIWGNPTYGIWGSFYWSSALTTPKVRRKEQYMWMDYNEDFTSTSYKDLGFTRIANYYSLDSTNDIVTGSIYNKLGSFNGSPFGYNASNGNVDIGTELYGSGPYGTSFIADGSSSINIPHRSSLSMYNTGVYTISTWIKPDDTTNSAIFSKWTSGGFKGYGLFVIGGTVS